MDKWVQEKGERKKSSPFYLRELTRCNVLLALIVKTVGQSISLCRVLGPVYINVNILKLRLSEHSYFRTKGGSFSPNR